MNLQLSIIIPTLNEERALPTLLNDLSHLNLPNYEIIIADSGSTDRTRPLVTARARRNRRLRIVSAGTGAATARNAGAKIARGHTLFFLDADQRVTPTFMRRALAEFNTRALDIACFYPRPIPPTLWSRLFWWTCNNLLFRPGQYITPSGSTGAGLIIRRALHERINGFNETIHVIHDHDYVRRASKIGKFRMITSVKSTFNMRRFDEEGRFLLCAKYILLTLFHLFHIKQTPFPYEFGHHESP